MKINEQYCVHSTTTTYIGIKSSSGKSCSEVGQYCFCFVCLFVLKRVNVEHLMETIHTKNNNKNNSSISALRGREFWGTIFHTVHHYTHAHTFT